MEVGKTYIFHSVFQNMSSHFSRHSQNLIYDFVCALLYIPFVFTALEWLIMAKKSPIIVCLGE